MFFNWIKILAILFVVALIPLGSGCVTAGKTASAKSSKPQKTSPLFGHREIRPEGNSVLHYIDSRLYNLREAEKPTLEALKRSVEEDAASPYLHAELARTLAEVNQFEQATLEADKALSLDPKSAKTHLLRGKLYSVKKESDQAIQEYETCLRLDPEVEECYTMLTREYLLAKRYPLAIQSIQRLLKRDPNSTSGLYFLGTIYTSYQKDPKKAMLAFQKVLEEDPEDIRSLASLAQLYLEEKKYRQALDLLLRIEKLAPTDVPMKLRIGLLYYELQDYDHAIDRFTEALKLSPKNDRVSYYLGLLEAQRKNYGKALEYLKAIPPGSEVYKDALVRTVLLLREMNQVDKAVAYTKEALSRRQDIPELYEVLATLYSRQGNLKLAIKTLDQGLEKLPNQEKLLFTKGVLLDKAGEFEKSMEVMREILKVNADNASALNYIGYSYAEKGIHLKEALELISKANQLRPNDGYILDSLAWAYFKLGNRAKALKLLQQANQLTPNEPAILEHLGDVYLDLGDTAKARSYFREALAASVKEENPEERELAERKRIEEKLTALTQ